MKVIKKYNKYLIILLIFFLFFLISTYGRYIYNGIRNYYLSTKSFYFNSDKLSENNSKYFLSNWSGVEPVSIVFNMDSKKNNLVSSPSDISYEITYTCSDNIVCNSSKNEGIILKSQATDSFEVVMSPSISLQNGDEIWIEVEAKATNPYQKTLKGKFTIKVATLGLSYEILDVGNRAYLDFEITNTLDYYKIIEAFDTYNVGDKIEIADYLNLSSANKAKCASAIITLSFNPNILRLDMTSEFYLNSLSKNVTTLSDNNEYVNSFSFKVDAISSNAIRFYKLIPTNNYTYPFVNSMPIINFQVE